MVALLLIGGRNFAVIQRSFRQLALAVVEIDLRLRQQIPTVEFLLQQAVEGVVLVVDPAAVAEGDLAHLAIPGCIFIRCQGVAADF